VSIRDNGGVGTTSATRRIEAPRAAVFAALVDPHAIARWKFPAGMTAVVHSFEGREGGTFRISLTYDDPTRSGKTAAQTDTYNGRFVRLVPDELLVEVDEFETTDPALRGEMTITIALHERDGATELEALHEGVPPGVSAADNQEGWDSALARLAALVEG
jgi:uncharacterized protein YndB with AHSA1/START domain